jgi:hypothetical protein
MDTNSANKVFYCESQKDSLAQILLLGINILFSFITALLTGIRMRAKSPCFEVSTKPASAPYSPGSMAGTPMPIAMAKSLGDSGNSREDMMGRIPKPSRSIQLNPTAANRASPSQLAMTSIMVDDEEAKTSPDPTSSPYKSPELKTN